MNKLFYLVAKSDTAAGGIYAYKVSAAGVPELQSMTPCVNLNFLAYSPDKRFLYGSQAGPIGGAVAFAVAPDGALTLLNHARSGGANACALTTDWSGKFLYVANYSSGDFSEFELENGELGRLRQVVVHTGSGPNLRRQEQAHVHYVHRTPDRERLLVIDLGIDALKTYRLSDDGLDADDVKTFHATPGSGPRHLVFDRSGHFAYLANELGNSVTILRYAAGEFTDLGSVSTLPDDFSGESKVAAIRFSADEKWLFVSNRGYDSIAVFAVDGAGGLRRHAIFASGGSSPRDINFLPGGNLFAAANEFSDTVAFFHCDGAGNLTGAPTSLTLPHPLYIFPA